MFKTSSARIHKGKFVRFLSASGEGLYKKADKEDLVETAVEFEKDIQDSRHEGLCGTCMIKCITPDCKHNIEGDYCALEEIVVEENVCAMYELREELKQPIVEEKDQAEGLREMMQEKQAALEESKEEEQPELDMSYTIYYIGPKGEEEKSLVKIETLDLAKEFAEFYAKKHEGKKARITDKEGKELYRTAADTLELDEIVDEENKEEPAKEEVKEEAPKKDNEEKEGEAKDEIAELKSKIWEESFNEIIAESVEEGVETVYNKMKENIAGLLKKDKITEEDYNILLDEIDEMKEAGVIAEELTNRILEQAEDIKEETGQSKPETEKEKEAIEPLKESTVETPKESPAEEKKEPKKETKKDEGDQLDLGI